MLVPGWLEAGAPSIAELHNRELRGDHLKLLTVEVTLEPPDEEAAQLGALAPLPITAGYAAEAPDGYSRSALWVALGEGSWLHIQEQGRDPQRAATQAAAEVALQALQDAAEGRGEPMRTRHAALLGALGGAGAPLRYEGIQHRDALGLVLEVEVGRSYDSVQVRVFDEAVCGGECTRGWRQEQKAERLGAPLPGDLTLVLVEDCAVFLSGEADERHGIFTGSEPFEAEIRWLDASGDVLSSRRGPFWGWQR